MLGGFSRERQGHRSFTDFDDYYRNWLKPNLLGDLHTVFMGSRRYWKRKQRLIHRLIKPGRGDPFLAACLFSALDHVGAYLAGSENEPLRGGLNVVRTARHLPSTRDIPHIISALGRNPVIHYNWTQTAMPMDDRSWAFGLDICGSPDERLHDILSLQSQPLEPLRPDMDEPPSKVSVLKLLLNIHVLHRQFRSWAKQDQALRAVEPEVFRKLQRLARCEGWSKPPKHHQSRADDEAVGIKTRRKWLNALKQEIRCLRFEAIELGVWTSDPDASTPMYRKRSGGGIVPPHLESQVE